MMLFLLTWIYAHITDHPDFQNFAEEIGMNYVKETYAGHLHCTQETPHLARCSISTKHFMARYFIQEDPSSHHLSLDRAVSITHYAHHRSKHCRNP